jgi:preprotein translocase subunit Sss1
MLLRLRKESDPMTVKKSKGSPAVIDRRVKLLLTVLKDGRWHRRLPHGAITARVVEACFDLKLIKRKLTWVRSRRVYNASFRITARGKKALKYGRRPDPEEFSEVMRVAI